MSDNEPINLTQQILSAMIDGTELPEPITLTQKLLVELGEVIRSQGGSVNSFKQLRATIREGKVATVLTMGDIMTAPKESGVSVTTSEGLTATVDEDTFIAKIGHSSAAAYEFLYDGHAWHLDGATVELSQFGISVTGTPTANDALIVHVSASEIELVYLGGPDSDVPANPELTHSASFITDDIQTYGTFAYSASQALVSVQEAIESGTTVYVIGDHCCYDGTTKQDGNFGFVAPVDIPAGAKIRHSKLGANESNADNYTKATVLGGKWTIYASDYSTLASNVETIEIETPDDEVLLGTVTCKDPQYLSDGAAHVNFTQRNSHGSNEAAAAAFLKWLNSDAAGAASGAIASWWTSSGEFDMPVRSTLPGWLHGMDPEFRACIAPVRKRTAKSIAEGYGYVDSVELVWIPSMTEIFGSNNNNIVETSPKSDGGDPNFAGPYPLYDGATDADRIKYYGGAARYWFLRSPYPSSASGVRNVNSSGALISSGYAAGTNGCVAGLTIA